MPQNIHINFTLKIIVGNFQGMFIEQFIINFDNVQDLIGFEKSTIIGKNIIAFAFETRIQVAKILLETSVKRYFFISFLQLTPIVQD